MKSECKKAHFFQRTPIPNHTLFTIFIILGLISSSFAQVTTDHLYRGVRAAALVGSNVAHQYDAWAVFENPAGLTHVDHFNVGLAYEQIVNQSFLPHSMVALAYPTTKLGVLGLSIENLSVSYNGHNLSNETAIGISQGLYLQKDYNSTLAIGYGLKFLQVDYGQSAGTEGDGSNGINLGISSAIGMDLGLLAGLRNRHWIGAQVININKPKLGQANAAVRLPMKIRFGMAYSPYNLVWTTFGMTRTAGYNTQYHAGVEYQIVDGIILLSGVQSNPNRFGFGFRLQWKSLRLDYGLLTHPVLPMTHQISIGFEL